MSAAEHVTFTNGHTVIYDNDRYRCRNCHAVLLTLFQFHSAACSAPDPRETKD